MLGTVLVDKFLLRCVIDDVERVAVGVVCSSVLQPALAFTPHALKYYESEH